MLTSQQYLRTESTCPLCLTDGKLSTVGFEDHCIKITCTACHCTFYEVYELTGIADLTDTNGNPIAIPADDAPASPDDELTADALADDAAQLHALIMRDAAIMASRHLARGGAVDVPPALARLIIESHTE